MSATPVAIDWRARVKALNLQTRPFIGGRFDDSLAERGFDCVSPIDGRKIASLERHGSSGRRRRGHGGAQGVRSRRLAMAPRARKKILLKLAGADDGAPRRAGAARDARHGQADSATRRHRHPGAANCIAWFAETIDKLYDEIAPTDPTALAMITREPVGVVAAVRAVELPADSWRRGRSARARRRQLASCSSPPSSRR